MGEEIERLNALPPAELRALLLRCLAVPRWADELVAARPFAGGEALVALGAEQAAGLSDAEVRQALADHPRIGERADPEQATAERSRREQSGVDAAAAAEFRAVNRAYEDRFGHLYLVCAAGRSGPELLADARSRLSNDPGTELAVVRRELAGIAAGRIRAELAR
jgi:2-oxo-4-hydroxy-4-carboxy-5-ureidoimidazoline decarboxylase